MILIPIKIITGTAKAIVSLNKVCVILTNKGASPVKPFSKEKVDVQRNISLPTAFLLLPILIT